MSSKCCIQNCETTKGSLKKVTLYRFPDMDSPDYMAWVLSVGSRISPAFFKQKRYQLCSLHFADECFETGDITILRDGQEVIMPRTVRRLKKGSIPTVFPPSTCVIKGQLNEPKPFCVVRGCAGDDSEIVHLFHIPGSDLSAWCQNLRLNRYDLTIYSRVCSRHFEQQWMDGTQLKAGARPTLNLGHILPVVHPCPTADKEYFVRRICCILNCRSESPPFTLFNFPVEPNRLRHWNKLCLFKVGLELSNAKYICGKHFSPAMIWRKGNQVKLSKSALPYKMIIATAPLNTANSFYTMQTQKVAAPLVESTVVYEINEIESDANQAEINTECNRADTEMVEENILYPEITLETDPIDDPTTTYNSMQNRETANDCVETVFKTEFINLDSNDEQESQPEFIVPEETIDNEEFIKIEPQEADSMSSFTETENLNRFNCQASDLDPAVSSNSNDCQNCVKLLEKYQAERERCSLLEKQLAKLRGKFEAYKALNTNKLLRTKVQALGKRNKVILLE